MKILNSNTNDLEKIMELYRIATKFMIKKNQVSWPIFPEKMIIDEINNNKQWKLIIDGEIACIWANTLSDELIWGKTNDTAVYIHRIATNPNFRGNNLMSKVVDWADNFCINNKLDFIRMDTVGFNKGLIKHYEKLGFDFLGTKELKNTNGLPDHYTKGPVCLFERKITAANKELR